MWEFPSLNLGSSSSYGNNKLGKLIKKSDFFKHLGVVQILMGFFNLPMQIVEYYLKWPTISSSPVLSSSPRRLLWQLYFRCVFGLNLATLLSVLTEVVHDFCQFLQVKAISTNCCGCLAHYCMSFFYPPKIRTISCPITSVKNYHYLCNIAEERSSLNSIWEVDNISWTWRNWEGNSC